MPAGIVRTIGNADAIDMTTCLELQGRVVLCECLLGLQ